MKWSYGTRLIKCNQESLGHVISCRYRAMTHRRSPAVERGSAIHWWDWWRIKAGKQQTRQRNALCYNPPCLFWLRRRMKPANIRCGTTEDYWPGPSMPHVWNQGSYSEKDFTLLAQLVTVTCHGNFHLELFPFWEAVLFQSPKDFLSVFNWFPENRKIHTNQPELNGNKADFILVSGKFFSCRTCKQPKKFCHFSNCSKLRFESDYFLLILLRWWPQWSNNKIV